MLLAGDSSKSSHFRGQTAKKLPLGPPGHVQADEFKVSLWPDDCFTDLKLSLLHWELGIKHYRINACMGLNSVSPKLTSTQHLRT